MQTDFQVVAIGNAIVDMVTSVDDIFLKRHGFLKGSLELIDYEKSKDLLKEIIPLKQSVGGSTSNSLSVVSALGSKSAFIGHVSSDILGEYYLKTLKKEDIHFVNSSQNPTQLLGTAHCLIFVTPDGERTMRTFLGASAHIEEETISPDIISRSQILMLEGYLINTYPVFAANLKAARIAKEAGRLVVMTTSDVICSSRYRAQIIDFTKHYADILISNEAEVTTLFKVSTLNQAVNAVREIANVGVITCGAHGSYVFSKTSLWHIPSIVVKKVVDLTGAGDAYAGGFLHGYAQGLDIPSCGQLGAIAAGKIISHYGARFENFLLCA